MMLLTMYAMQFVGTPYIYGGKEPTGGLDCSGLIQILLKSVSEDPPGDQNAQAYFDYYSEAGRGEYNRQECGALVFFGESATKISHIGMLLDQNRFIEAGGGHSTTLTKAQASSDRAFVRLSHLSSRKDIIAIIRPRYRAIGCI